jgi:hypothetical protein
LTDTLFHHDLTGLARAGAIIAGLAATTAGYLIGSAFLWKAKLKDIIAPNRVLHHQNTAV